MKARWATTLLVAAAASVWATAGQASGPAPTACSGPGKVVAIHTTCARARAVANAYPRKCVHQRYCDAAGFGTCRHLAAQRIECVAGTSSDRVRPIVRFTTAHRVP